MKNIKLLLFLAFFGVSVLAFVPFSSMDARFNNLGDLNVDVAFPLAMPYFLENGFQFGKQVIFTYGPLAILHTAIASIQWFPLIIFFRMVLIFGVLFSSFFVIEGCGRNSSKYILLGGFIGLWLLWLFGPIESFFMFPALAVAYFSLHRLPGNYSVSKGFLGISNKYIWLLLTVLASLLSLAKFSYFVVAAIAFSLLLISDSLKRKASLFPAIYICSLVTFWLVSGQNLANLPHWIALSLNLSGGYSDAMSKGFLNPYGIGQVSAYYAGLFIIIALSFYQTYRRGWSIDGSLSFLLSLFVGLLSVRYAFGGNQLENSVVLLFVLLWFVTLGHFYVKPAAGETVSRKTLGILSIALLACVVLGWLLGGVNFPFYSLSSRLTQMRSNAAHLVSWIKMSPSDYYLASLERSHALWSTDLEFSGQTVDVYPQHTGVVIGRAGLEYLPRPAFLSLNAHTRDLALLNKQHLEAENSPDLVLFQVVPREASVNNRHPATADGPSWPVLISKYDVKDSGDDGLLLLEKRATPRSAVYTPVLNDLFPLGKPIDLPDSASRILWAELEVERSFLGKLAKTFYKSPHLLIDSITVDGQAQTYQVVPELGRAGFILSPLVVNNDEFSQLFSVNQSYGNAVSQITVRSEDGLYAFWHKSFRLKVDELKIE